MELLCVICVTYLSVAVHGYREQDVDGYFAKENVNISPSRDLEQGLRGSSSDTELAASRQVVGKVVTSS